MIIPELLGDVAQAPLRLCALLARANHQEFVRGDLAAKIAFAQQIADVAAGGPQQIRALWLPAVVLADADRHHQSIKWLMDLKKSRKERLVEQSTRYNKLRRVCAEATHEPQLCFGLGEV